LLLTVICGNVYGLQGSTAANGSNAQAVHSLGITGEGIKVGLITAKNVQANHLAFLDSNGQTGVFNHDYTGDGFAYDFHDTPFAGIIKSRGTYDHPNDIGVAPDAEIHCGRVVDNNGYVDSDTNNFVEDALHNLITNIGCRVIVTGIAFPDSVTPNGQSQWTLMYDYFAEQYDVVFANAAGNFYSSITVFGDCYNGITTGGLEEPITDNYFRVGDVTNPGPTTDGRRKPDVMAPSTYQVAPGYSSGSNNYWNTGYGDGATSWAVPHTAGVAALLLQYANQTADANARHNEVIKAAIINSTFPNILNEAGNPTYPADPNNVWHNERGYGRIDAYRAYLTLSAGKVAAGTSINSITGWAYNALGNSQTHTYLINAQRKERLVLTVAWNRAVTREWQSKPWELYWEYYDEGTPRFNIDITVKDPCNTVVYSENDANNNLIKVDIPLELTGEYEITLTNTTSKTRGYAMAFERLAPLTGDFNIDYIVDELDLRQMALNWLTDEPDTDIIADGVVNWLDFAGFAENWLKTEPKYYNP
jgi:hypothetical protein